LENVFGLLVEDGQLAIGILVALIVTWALATYGRGAIVDVAGWVLLALVMVLVLVNLYLAGRRARRKAS
jgi:hypothetical protein